MALFTIITLFVAAPILLANACHEIGQREKRAPVVHPADPIDHNFDSMWEAANRR